MVNQRKLAVILHADVVGSTGLVQCDEHLAHERIQDAFRRFANTISTFGGTTHEMRGDALVVEFARASDAVNAALTFQSENQVHNESLSGEIRPELRVGIALGEVIIADNTVTGAGVVLAQRLEQCVPPGEVCISAAMREAIPERMAVDFFDLGEQELKGFERRQRIFASAKISGGSTTPVSSLPPLHPVTSESQQSARPSIVVLPFSNISPGSDADYLADGLTEDVTTTLSCQRWLLTIARPSAMDIAARTSDLKSIGEALGVSFVLSGNVRQAGPRLRVTATLSEADSERQLWSNRYDRIIDDIFDLQDEISRSIVAELVPEITSADLESISGIAPQNLSAWESYQRGVAQLNHHSTESFERARSFFEAAIANDPDFSSAHAHFGFVLYRQIAWAILPREAVDELASVAEKAVDLDPRDSNAHVVAGLARMLRGDPDAAIDAMNLALQLNPSSAFAYVMRGVVNTFGRLSHDEALKDLEFAERLSPVDRFERSQRKAAVAFANFCMARYENAVRAGEDAWRAGGMFGGFYCVAALVALGERDRAEAFAAEILERHPSLSVQFCRDTCFWVPVDAAVERCFRFAEQAGIPG